MNLKKFFVVNSLILSLVFVTFSVFSDDDDSDSEKPASDVVVTKLVGGKFKLVAKGRASEDAIESGQKIKMQSTACEVAKLKIKKELKELLPDENNPYNYSYEDKRDILENGLYCELTFIYDKNSTRNLKK